MNRSVDPSRLGWARPGLVEAAGASLLFAGALLELVLSGISSPLGADAIAAAATTAPLAWRSAAPVIVVAVTTGGLALGTLLGFPSGDLLVPYLAPLVALYSVALHCSGPKLLAAVAIGLGAYAVTVAASPSGGLSDMAYVAAGMLAAVAVGLAVRRMGLESDSLAARATELERDRDEAARAAIAGERARIARELHDVIGHSISVMGIQAGAVRRVLAPEHEREREALLAVERVGRDAVTEMRRLLGFLRPTDGLEPGDGPAPTLARLDDLVGEMRLAGLDVDLVVEGDLDDLSLGRALAAFRIIQEALTNALKHAPGSPVTAVLRRTPEALVIEITNPAGDAPPPPPSSGGGYGLVGMRERVALYGGTLEAGPTPARGYEVVARLPTADR
jgi:signal transduction histidine kinase